MTVHHKKSNQFFFGRSIIFLTVLLLQLALLFCMFYFFAKYANVLYGFFVIVSTLLVIYIVNRRQNPAFKLAWIIPMQAIPIFGAILYLFVRFQPGSRKVAKKLEHIEAETALLNKQDPKVFAYLKKYHPAVANLSTYSKDCCGVPISPAENITYFSLGEEMWEQMLRDLRQAKRFIFMEYFIVERGEMWNAIEDVLAERASAGVEVRFLYDGIGSISTVSPDFPQTLHARGIDCRIFAKAKPLLSTVQNNRDHRKITVIDGEIAYTGGANLADEYINRREKYGHWKDTAVRLDGQAVDGFTTLFLQLWHADEADPLYRPYLRHAAGSLPGSSTAIMHEGAPPATGSVTDAGAPGATLPAYPGFAMPYGDNPFDDQTIALHLYLDILYGATSYVHIMSPYLILDNELIVALRYAASRGVEVILMVPHIPDKAYAYYLARSYYRELIEAGVQIQEYTPGFIHAKVFVSDDRQAVVGTTNLDYRSLYLHFECGTYLFAHPVIAHIERDFQETLAKCQRITQKDCRQFPVFKRIAGKALRLIAPLM